MQHLKLLGGKTPEELWWLTNTGMPGLILLVILPRWKPTRVLTLIGPLLLALVYTLGLLSVLIYPENEPDPDANFMSLEGVVALFKDETTVFVGWVHYVVFDALVARWVVLDSVALEVSILCHLFVVIPCVFFTIMAGPMGFLLWFLLRNFVSTSKLGQTTSANKSKNA